MLGASATDLAFYDGAWHYYDTDLEVVPTDSSGTALGLKDLEADENIILKFYNGRGDSDFVGKLAGYITTVEDNTLMSYPAGSWFNWKAQLLAETEKITDILKFVVPALLIFLGLYLTRRNHRSNLKYSTRF